MNLSTARSEKRMEEVGIRKVVGSSRHQLIGQFYAESLAVSFLAFVLAIGLALLLLPLFNEIVSKTLRIPLTSLWFWVSGLVFSLLIGLIAGSYPAWFLSSFLPLSALKGSFKLGRMATLPRQSLVVLQFTISIILITGTLVVFQQIQFSKNRSIGYKQDRLVNIPIKDGAFNEHFGAFRNDLLQSGLIEEVTLSTQPITQTWSTMSGFDWEGRAPESGDQFWTLGITHDFGNTVGWQIKAGRDFSREMSTDTAAFIVNEAGARYLGFDDPIGKSIQSGPERAFKIIGVVGDMITQSPYEDVRQMIFFSPMGKMPITLLLKSAQELPLKEPLLLWKKYMKSMIRSTSLNMNLSMKIMLSTLGTKNEWAN